MCSSPAHRSRCMQSSVADPQYRSTVSRFDSIPKPLLVAVAFVGGIFLLLVAANYAYWVGEGRPGTPEEFRDRVDDAGLDVIWLNNGSSGGDGTAVNECGDPVRVTINDLGGELWVTSDLGREPLTPEAVDRILQCG